MWHIEFTILYHQDKEDCFLFKLTLNCAVNFICYAFPFILGRIKKSCLQSIVTNWFVFGYTNECGPKRHNMISFYELK